MIYIDSCQAVDYHIKNVKFNDSSIYLVISSDSKDIGITKTKLYARLSGIASDKGKADLFAVEKGDNSLFISKKFLGAKSEFYLYPEVTTQGKGECHTTITLEKKERVQLTKDKEYNYISNPSTGFNKDYFEIEVSKEDFPIVLSIISPNDESTLSSTANIQNGDQTTGIEFVEFNGGLITVLDSTIMKSENQPGIINIIAYSFPNSKVSIYARTKNPENLKVKAGQSLMYGFTKKEECFTFTGHENKNYSINVIPFKKNLKISESTGKVLSGDLDYQDTFLFSMENNTEKSFCFESSEDESTVYGFQIEDYTDKEKNYLKEPLYHGINYQEFTLKNSMTYYRNYRREYFLNGRTSMNVKAISGRIEVYKTLCHSFPNCEKLDEKKVHEINGFFTTSMNVYHQPSVFSAEQTLLVVKCLEKTSDCKYEVSYFSDSDIMELKADSVFSNFMINSETADFKIRNEDESIDKIVIKLMSISGDAFIEMIPNPFCDYNFIYYGNNIIVEITLKKQFNDRSKLVDTFFFIVRTSKNAFYNIYYELQRQGKTTVNIDSGIYTLESIPVVIDAEYTFVTRNRYKQSLKPFVITFFPVNCEINVKRVNEKEEEDKQIDVLDGLYQDTITNDDKIYKKDEYHYKVKFTGSDSTFYENKRCSIYVTAVEQNHPVVLGNEQFIQNALNNKFTSMEYIIPFTNIGEDFIGNLVIENEIPINVEMRAEEQKIRDILITQRNIPLIITKEDYSLEGVCSSESNICNFHFIFSLSGEGSEFVKTHPFRFDFIGRTQEYIPSYIKKGLVREEIVIGDTPYFFITDIGKDEEGEVKLNFNRGNGIVAARIVPKTFKDDEPIWEGRYEFPLPNEETGLKYDEFTQSLYYDQSETNKCQFGCELLITVDIVEEFKEDKKKIKYINDFSIFIKSAVIGGKLGGIVDIPANEFISGHIYRVSETFKKDVYTLTIHNDASKILLELHGNLVEVYGKWDTEEIPQKEDSPFKCKSDGLDRICEILPSNGSFTGHRLTFVVASESEKITDLNIYYTFKFRTIKKEFNDLDIYEINSEHAVKCQSKGKSNCYFMFPLRNYNAASRLFFYVEGDYVSEYKLFAKSIDANEYEGMSVKDIKSVLPSDKNYEWSSIDNYWTNHLIIDGNILKDNMNDFILISVYCEKSGMISMLASFKENLDSVLPKPSTTQLFEACKNEEDKDEQITFILPNDKDFSIYIKSIIGNFIITSNDESKKNFALKGNGDSILVTFNAQESEKFVTSIEIDPMIGENLFILSYIPIPPKDNIAEIQLGSSTEISLDDVGFPVDFYAKVPKDLEENDFIVNIKYIEQSTIKQEKLIDSFKVWGVITDFNAIQKRIRDKSYKPGGQKIDGIYNPFIRTGVIPFSIGEFSNNGNNFNYIYFEINTTELNEKKKYEDIHLEVSTIPLNLDSMISPIEQYNHVYLQKDQETVNKHILKRSGRSYNYLTLEIGTEDENVEFGLVQYKEGIDDRACRKIDESLKKHIIKESKTGGKKTYLFNFKRDEISDKLILSFYFKEESNISKDTYYVFKYSSDEIEPNFVDLLDDSTKFVYYSNKDLLIKSLKPVQYLTRSVYYPIYADFYVVALPKNVEQKLEYNTIAIRDIKFHSIYFYNPTDIKDKLHYLINDFPSDDSNSLLMYAIGDLDNQLFAYKLVNNVTDNPQESKDVIDVNMNEKTFQYSVEENDDKYSFFFNVNISKFDSLTDQFFVVTVKNQESSEKDIKNIVYMSTTLEKPDRTNSDLISDEEDVNYVIISRKMIENTRKFHLTVNCEDFCRFNIEIKNVDTIALKPGESIRHLFTSSSNSNLNVTFEDKEESQQIQSNDGDKYLTIYTFGGSGNMGNFIAYFPKEGDREVIEMSKFLNGYIITISLDKYSISNGGKIILNIFSDYGLVNIGSRIVNGRGVKKFEYEIRGLLANEVKKDCYPILEEPSESGTFKVDIVTNNQVKVYLAKDVVGEEQIIPDTEETVVYQKALIYPLNERAKICFERINEIYPTAYSFQISEHGYFVTTDSAKLSPKINGVIYKENTQRGKYVYYRHSKYKKSLEKLNSYENTINFNFRTIKGSPKFYIDKCNIFPYCDYDKEIIEEKMKIKEMREPTRIGDFFIGSIDTAEEVHELYSSQILLVVECPEDSKHDCDYEISFYDEEDTMLLRPNEPFEQYMNKNDEDKFSVLILDKSVSKVEIDLMVLSGDAYLTNITAPGNLEMKSIELGTKQIKIFEKSDELISGQFDFSIKTRDGAYYIVTVHKFEKDSEIYKLPSSTVIFDGLDTTEGSIVSSKKYSFDHDNEYKGFNHWAVHVLSQNCEIELSVLGQREPISTFCVDHYCYINLTNTDKQMQNKEIQIEIRYLKKFVDNVDDKYCRYYIASQEISNDNEIVYGDNAPFKLLFDQLSRKSKLVYPFPNLQNAVIMNLNLEDESYIKVNTLINNNILSTNDVSKTRAIITEELNKYCPFPEEPCVVEYEIEAQKEKEIEQSFVLLFTIKSDTKDVVYIQKRVLREEYSFHDSIQYFVTDVGNKEKGVIQLHFNRGKGKMYAKIVPVGLQESSPDYQGRVRLPTSSDSDYQMNEFTLQINYDSSEKDCTNQCQLFIGVEDSQVYSNETQTKYVNDFSIFIKETECDGEKIEAVTDIPANEYIVGNLKDTDDKGTYDYYIFNVPENVEHFFIEMYTEACDMFINKKENDEVLPTREKNQYFLEANGGSNIFEIEGQYNESLKGDIYIIGVGADKIDQIVSSRYMFRIIMVEKGFNFYQEKNADESVISKIESERKQYSHFIIPVRNYDITKDFSMYLYTYSDSTDDCPFYVRFISEKDYSSLTPDSFNSIWPNENYYTIKSSDRIYKNSLYIENQYLKKEEYILISVKVKPNNLFFLTSTFRMNVISPSIIPFSTQVLIIDFSHESSLQYPDNEDYVLDVYCIYGEGTVSFGDEAYDLKGIRDSILLSINRDDFEVRKREIKFSSSKSDEPLVIMLSYNIRPREQNFDEIVLKNTGSISITDDDLPVVLYANIYEGKDFSFNFRVNDFITNSISFGNDLDFKVSAGFIDYDDVVNRRNDKSYEFTKFEKSGIADKNGVGMVSLSKDEYEKAIEKYKIKSPYFYISIKKSEENKNIYTHFHMDYSYMDPRDLDTSVPINQYIYTSLREESKYSWYQLLKEDPSHKEFLLQFSSGNKNIKFALTDKKPSIFFKDNSTSLIFIDNPKERTDSVIIKFTKESNSLYLAVFSDDEQISNSGKYEYAFKYSTDKEINVRQIPLEKPNVSYNKETKEVNVKVKKNLGSPTMSVKIIEKSKIPGDVNINTFAISSDVDYIFGGLSRTVFEDTIFEQNFKLSDEDKFKKGTYTILITANDYLENDVYTYTPVDFEINDEGGDSKDNNKKKIMIIIIVASSIILILCIVLVVKFILTKKSTEESMLKTSFINNKSDDKNVNDDEERGILS
jgi:hypothetical protein